MITHYRSFGDVYIALDAHNGVVGLVRWVKGGTVRGKINGSSEGALRRSEVERRIDDQNGRSREYYHRVRKFAKK